MANNQTKCGGIIYEKIVMRAADDERVIYYGWPYQSQDGALFSPQAHQ